MKKKNRTQVMYLTQHILEEYWQSNLEPLKEHLHKDIIEPIPNQNQDFSYQKSSE